MWASTQAVPATAERLAHRTSRLPPARVKCITHYMGGGFGSKFGPDIQGIAAAELARKARAPVKLMLDRAEEVTVGGNRPSAYGTVKIAGTKNGRIQRLRGRLLRLPRRRPRRDRQLRPAALRLPPPFRTSSASISVVRTQHPDSPGHARSRPSAELRPHRAGRRRPGRQARHQPARHAPAQPAAERRSRRRKTDPTLVTWPCGTRSTRRQIEIIRKLSDWDAELAPAGPGRGRRSRPASAWPCTPGAAAAAGPTRPASPSAPTAPSSCSPRRRTWAPPSARSWPSSSPRSSACNRATSPCRSATARTARRPAPAAAPPAPARRRRS